MRSTITLYFAGSPMRVPPSFTNSAATPSFLPSSFTRTIKAGGKLYSRPQRRPTFFICVLLQEPVGLPRSTIASIHGVCGRSAWLSHAGAGLRNQMAHYRFQVARLLKDPQLPVRARAFFQDGVDIFDGAAAPEFTHNITHESKKSRNYLPHRPSRFFAKIDLFPSDPGARRAPFFLFDQRPPVKPPTHIAFV